MMVVAVQIFNKFPYDTPPRPHARHRSKCSYHYSAIIHKTLFDNEENRLSRPSSHIAFLSIIMNIVIYLDEAHNTFTESI